MFSIDHSGLIRLEKELEKVKKTALPFAVGSTLNQVARSTQKKARVGVGKQFILKNTWSRRSIRFDKVKGTKISAMESVTGSVAPHMEKIEYGDRKQKTGAHGVPIATSYAAGQGDATQRTRQARRLSRIRLRPNRLRGRRATPAAVIRSAAGKGSKFVFLKLKKSKGIFRVLGRGKNTRIKMMYDVSRPNVYTAPKPWLKPAHDSAIKRVPGMYSKALKAQLTRHTKYK